jgi:hypothetical protein
MKTKCFLKALVFAGFLSFCGTLLADPLNNWHWRNPLPNGNPQFGAQTLNGIIFTNNTFFAVGNFGVISTSIDTTNWTQTITATSNQLNDIIYADGKFVTVGTSGTVETSSDGTNWVLQNSGTTSSLNSVAYGHGKFVAVGNAVMASSNAVNWSPAVSGFSTANAVAGSSFGFVAIDGSTNAYFSSDGLNWTYHSLTAPPGDQLFNGPLAPEIVTFFNGSFLIGACKIVSSGSDNVYMYVSTDGSDWTSNALGNVDVGIGGFSYNFFMTGNKQAIAGGQADGQIFLQFSPDGVTWSQTNVNVGSGYIYNNAGAYGNGSYVIVGQGGVKVSPDVVNWSDRPYMPPPEIGPTSTFSSIAFSNGMYVVTSSSSFAVSTNDSTYVTETNMPSLSSVVTLGTNFVAVGSSGQIYTSTNGFSWTQRNSGTANNLHTVAAGNNLLVAVGDNGAVQTSPTGVIWTSRASGTSLPLYGVVYSNGLYVAVGQEGTVVTSPDGINWTAQDSTVLNNLQAVTYGSAGVLAVGADSTILTSPDGANWTQQNPGISASFESATFGNGYYLVTSTNAIVLTSPDGVNWTSRNVGATGGQALYGSAFINGRFDVVGSSGTILESDPVPPLFDIEIHDGPPTVTIFATPGSTFRIQSCSNLAAPAWTTVATFNNASAITSWTNTAPVSGECYFRAVSP